MRFGLLAIVIALWFMAGSLAAQDHAFIVTVDDLGADAEEFDATLIIDNSEDLAGWAMGVCHDEGALTVREINDGSALDDIDTLFNACTIYDEDEFGVTCAAAVAIGQTLPVGVHEIAVVTYDVEDGGDDTTLEFCDLGDPVVGNSVVDVQLNEIDPELFDSDVPFGVTRETFEFTVSNDTVGYDVGSGEATFSITASVMEHEDSPGNPNTTYGFSMSLAHDEDLLSVTDVVAGEVLDDLADGAGPEFFETNILDDGFTLGVVYSISDTEITLDFGESQDVVEITYETVPDALIDNIELRETTLRFSNTLADPPIENAVVYTAGGELARVRRNHGTLTLIPGGVLFLRGDCNANDSVDIGDGIAVLRFVFEDNETVACEDACDANDSGDLTLGDGLRILNFLFIEGEGPAAPFPGCGGDPTVDDGLDCEEGSLCD